MPGKQVRDWEQYHALRRKGFSKAKSASITNSKAKKRRKKRRK